MSEIERHGGLPSPSVGIIGHSRASSLGEMDAALKKWLMNREPGYREFCDHNNRRRQARASEEQDT